MSVATRDKIDRWCLGFIMPLLCCLRKRKEDTYVILPPAFGDIVYGLAFIGELVDRTKQEGGKVYVIAHESRRQLVLCWKGDFCPVFLNQSFLWKLWYSFLRVHPYIKFFRRYKIYSVLPIYIMKYKKEKRLNGLTGLDIVSNHLFGKNSCNFKISHPVIENREIVSIPNFFQNNNRIIVLNANSNSMHAKDTGFFRDIAERLRNDGYLVYSNTPKGCIAVPGTEPLDCDIFEFWNICNNIPLVVSIRTGLMDWCVNTKARFFIYYFDRDVKDEEQSYFDYYTFKPWREDIKECVFTDPSSALKCFDEFYSEFKNL